MSPDFLKFWKERPCFCDEAQKAVGGADTICASCFINRRKQPQHIVYYSTLSSGTLIIQDFIGRPHVRSVPNPQFQKMSRDSRSPVEKIYDRFGGSWPLGSFERETNGRD